MKMMQNADLKNRRVLLRVDLNVPIDDLGNILDATRITRLIPTIKFLVKHKAKIILISHLGRPAGKMDDKLSLAQLLPTLREHYQAPVVFCADYKEAVNRSQELSAGEILLLENLRFHPQEEDNDHAWAESLSELAEVYINDAFACCHRAHASIEAVTHFLPSYAGLLLQEELTSLELGLKAAKHPAVAVVGGKKVSSKYEVVQSLINKMDCIMLAGGMANTFLAAQGYDLGKSFVEKEFLPEVNKFLKEMGKDKLLLPLDFTVVNEGKVRVVDLKDITSQDVIGDIGPQTLFHWCEVIKQSRTLLWNGPLGIYEDVRFSAGSDMIARCIAKQTVKGELYSLAGGGDVIAAIEKNGLADSFSYISTAGGAFLEWLADGSLPGIDALSVKEHGQKTNV